MEARGRGRGLGRSRGHPLGASGQRPGGPPQQQAAPPQGAWGKPAPAAAQAPAGAWGQKPAQAQPAAAAQQGAWVRPQAPPSWPRPQVRPQAPVPAAGGSGEPIQAMEVEQVTTGGGDAASQGKSIRGRVVNRREILYTKPKHLTSKTGTTGSPINLSANYFQLKHAGKWCLYQYRVDFAPDIDDIKKRRFLVKTAVKDTIKSAYLFDGTIIFSPEKLHPEVIELFADDDSGLHVRITIRLIRDLEWGDHHYIQVFNLIMRRCLVEMGLQEVGRNYYLPALKIVIAEHKIQLWPGFFTSMRQHEQNILLNVDLQFKFMRTDTVHDLLMECQGANIRREFQAKIIGSVVLTYYNNKTYRIDDVDFTSTPQSTFTKKDGTEIRYCDYFKNRYQLNVRDMNQPLLVSNSKPREVRAGLPEKIVLIPELCQLTGLSDRQRENFNLMKTLDSHTKVGPEGRIKKLNEFARQMASKPKVMEQLRHWDLDIANKLVEFKGRVLPSEFVSSGGGDRGKYSAGPQADWTRELKMRPMISCENMARLAVICPLRLKAQTQEFMQYLTKAAANMKWNLSNFRIMEIPDDRPGTYLQEVEKVVNSVHPTMLLVVLSNNNTERYSAIKKKCYIEKGIPSQMIVARNLTSKGVFSIATKVVIQMNCKIGGVPWSVSIPLSGLMVVGYDVCRDTVNKKKSFAGMVASLDRNITRYFSAVYEHSMEEELSNCIAAFLVIACKKYKELNGNYPDRICVYRDGVGEGQIPFVHEQEVTTIKKRLKDEIYQQTDLKMAYIIVSKRINTKIFAGNNNPPPGTVVDDVITLPERYDFYIVSQCVRQGTVAPTSYNVIEDTMGLPPDKLQVLTYKMTHLYYNWSGTIRVPAPCQYAHKLAFLTSQSLHRSAHPDLESVLYYL